MRTFVDLTIVDKVEGGKGRGVERRGWEAGEERKVQGEHNEITTSQGNRMLISWVSIQLSSDVGCVILMTNQVKFRRSLYWFVQTHWGLASNQHKKWR